MHQRQQQRVLCLVSTLVLMGISHPALAEHTEEEQITENTAYTLRDGEIRLGLWKVEYGVLDRVDIGSYTFPWLLRIASLTGKYEWYRGEHLSISNKLSVFRWDLRQLQSAEIEDPVIFQIVPVEMAASYRFNESWTLSVEGIYTNVSVEGSYNEDDLNGAAAVTNFQWTSTLEWRLSERFALLLHGRSLAFQATDAAASSTIMVDPYTTVEVVGDGETDALNVEGASSVSLIAHWAWSTLNLRLGLGYGNWSLPLVNFVLPTRTPIVHLDLFWRW
ncbi:MAG: hypothetical protein AAFS10_17605 [Myxococcota bacterium]